MPWSGPSRPATVRDASGSLCPTTTTLRSLDQVLLVPRSAQALTEGVAAADGSEATMDGVILCTEASSAVAPTGGGVRPQRAGVAWALRRRPEAYRGLAVPGFPDYFTVCGVNAVVAYASLLLSAELATDWIAPWARRILTEGIRSIEMRSEATERYNTKIQPELQDTSWTGNCPNFL